MSGELGKLLFELRAVKPRLEDAADQVGVCVNVLQRTMTLFEEEEGHGNDVHRLEELQRELQAIAERVGVLVAAKGI